MPLFEQMVDVAKKTMLRDKILFPVFFLIVGEEVLGGPVPVSIFDETLGYIPDDNQAKSRATYLMGTLAAKLKADRVIMIWDAAMRFGAADMNDPTELPLTYPKSMRTEIIMVTEVYVQNGKDRTEVVPYKGGDGEPVEFISIPNLSQVETRFTKIILQGYNETIKEL